MNQIDVSKIMNGNKKAILRHSDKQYMLSITRRGKLILTAAEDSMLTKQYKNFIHKMISSKIRVTFDSTTDLMLYQKHNIIP